MLYLLRLLLVALLIGFLSNCKKNNNTSQSSTNEAESPIVYDQYLAIHKNNYWIYQHFTIDEFGTLSSGSTDSCYYRNDTLVRNKLYHVMVNQNLLSPTSLLSDSLDCIIDARDGIVFSSTQFSNSLKTYYLFDYDPKNPNSKTDTICHCELKMSGKDSLLNLAAGKFKTHNAKTAFRIYPKYLVPGSAKTKYSYQLFSKGIGMVYEEYCLISNSFRMGRRLVRYHIN